MQNKPIFSVFFVLLFISFAFAQDAQKFFPKSDLITVGTFYYPEHWPQDQWDRDFKNMADLGFEYVHMAEFSWVFLEPEEGKFDFDWLDKAIELAAKHHLKIMLCTPTATTPVWMGIKYPETYLLDANYRRMEHGTRQMASIVNPTYRRLADRIVAEMAKRYGKDDRIWGWQLDNEPETKADYSPSAQQAFRQWLEKKYTTIDQLNRDWGTAFWGIRYSSFGEIHIHNPNTVGWWGNNPHALLDFKRFSSNAQAAFLDEHAALLRQHILPQQFITTNYVAVHGMSDPRRTEKLDFPAFTSYPNSGSANLGDEGFRLGSPRNLTQANDFFRPVEGVTGVMEIQPGQVNWGRVNPLLKPGVVRMWLWHCFAGGSQLASSYRYRQILYGVEQYHSGIMKTDGVTPSQGGQDYRQFIAEIKKLRALYNPDAREPNEITARQSAILWRHDNLWDHDRQPQSGQWHLWDHVLKYHFILKSFGAPVDYIPETDDFSKYNVLVVPAYQAIDSVLVEKWRAFAENGGALVLTCRTGTKTRAGHFWEGEWAEPIHDLIGADISGYDMLLPDGDGQVEMESNSFAWNNWADLLQPFEGTETVATYTNQFYAGAAAVVSRKVGKGSVTYVGVDTDDGQLERQVLQNLFAGLGASTENYPEGVFVYWRDGFMVAVNYSSQVYEVAIPGNARIVFGEKQLLPGGVTVWLEN